MARKKKKNSAAFEDEIENAEGSDETQSAEAEDDSVNARMGEADFTSVESAEASASADPEAPLASEGVDKMLGEVSKAQDKPKKAAKTQKVRAKDMKFKN